MEILTMDAMDITDLITDHTIVNKLDLNKWSGVVSCSGLHDDSEDDDSTIDTASSTSVGTDTDTKSETESMKTGDGLKLIEVDDDLDDIDDDKSDKSSVYDADIFDQISNCDIGVINDYDAYDHDSKAGRIPEFIFLLTGEHKQDHEYTIEFEEEEIDYQNMTKSGSNNDADDDQTDACTMVTKMLDQSNTNSFDDDEESFPCDDDSQYDDFDFGDDDEEEDISIINDVEEDDSMIIQVQQLTSMTSSTDEDKVEDDNDNDNDSCISMIDNLMDQFKLINLASMTESSSSSVYTTDDDEVEVEANVDADDDNDEDDDNDTDNDCLSKIDNLMEQFEFDFNELQSDMSMKFGTNNTKEFFSSLPPSTTRPTTTSESIISSALTTVATITSTTCDETPKTTTMIEITKEDDVYIDTNPIEYDLDKEQHTTINFQDYHHSWHQQQHNHHSCNRRKAIACDVNLMTTTIVTDDDDDDVDIYVDIDSIGSYDNNNSEQHRTMIEFHDDDHWEQQQQQQQQQQHHPCKRTETREECEGGALPLSLPSRQPRLRMLLRSKSEPLLLGRIKDDEQETIVLSKKQQQILDIVNDMQLIHHTHQIEQKPIKFNRQQYISIGQ